MNIDCHRSSATMNLIFGACRCSDCQPKLRDGEKKVESKHEDCRRFACYAPTLEGLHKHIECCRKHYPTATFLTNSVSTPSRSINHRFCVPMFIPKEDYNGSKCPDSGKVCEEVNPKEIYENT